MSAVISCETVVEVDTVLPQVALMVPAMGPYSTVTSVPTVNEESTPCGVDPPIVVEPLTLSVLLVTEDPTM